MSTYPDIPKYDGTPEHRASCWVCQRFEAVRQAREAVRNEPPAPLLTAAEVIAVLGLDGTDQS